jgi:serine/threonine-protein kinase
MLRAGERFDRYVIENLLGEGGMGRVYRARDERLRRDVALKVLNTAADASEAHHATTPGSRLLLHEARAAASLTHANTVAVYDVGEVGGTPFIAMELVDGTPLRTLVGDPSVALEIRLRVLADIARALQAAHARGILHRDVKPENVIVRRDGVVKVLDFGVARLLDPTHDGERPSASMGAAAAAADDPAAAAADRATLALETWNRTGMAGTPRYMAPEQLECAPLDARTDQFAWGVVAYELLTGKLPWMPAQAPAQAAVHYTIVSSILNAEPAPAAPLEAVAPPAVAAAVLRALSKKRQARFGSMADIVPIVAPPPPAPGQAHAREGTAFRKLVPHEPGIEVHAPLIKVVTNAFGPFKIIAEKYAALFGVPEGAGDDDWIPQERWLLAHSAMIAEVGGGVVFNMGQHIPAAARDWAPAGDMVAELSQLDVVYHANHRKHGRVMWDADTGTMLEGIGHYRTVVAPREKRVEITADDPYPCELDLGIVTAIAHKHHTSARVEHAPLGCRTVGAKACVYVVTWG